MDAHLLRAARRHWNDGRPGCWLSLLLAAALALAGAPGEASVRAVADLDLGNARSLDSLVAGVNRLTGLTARALDRDADSYPLQQAVIAQAGGVVGRTFDLYRQSDQSAANLELARQILLANHKILARLLNHSEGVIRHYQEHLLDNMADPHSFFLSDAWQAPQTVISLASYWLGWSGYTASLLVEADDERRLPLLEDAVAGFSRAFIDFSEEELTARSLYGRGLVYRQLGLPGRASLDFAAVKQKVGRDDPLYVQCLYQEALVAEATEQPERAAGLAAGLTREFGAAQIPEPVRIGLTQLETRLAAGAAADQQHRDGSARPDHRAGFLSLRRRAQADPALRDELYRHAFQHADAVADLSGDELGALGQLAVADWQFAQARFDAAAAIYEQLLRDEPPELLGRMAGPRFRLGYLAARAQRWDLAVDLLREFAGRYPESDLVAKAAEQYYAAALNRYQAAATDANYREYLRAAGQLVQHCGDCASAGDAYFALGRQGLDHGDNPGALRAFSRVPPGNGNYPYASLQVAVAMVAALEREETAHRTARDGAAARDHETLRERIARQQSDLRAGDAQARRLQPHWKLLEARFHLLGMSSDPGAALKALDALPLDGNDATLQWRIAGLRVLANGLLGDIEKMRAPLAHLAAAAATQPLAYDILQTVAARLYSAPDAASGALPVYQEIASLPEMAPHVSEYLPAVRLRLATLYQRVDALDQAVAVYEAILNADPDNADALRGLGQSQATAGRFDLALEPWRRLSGGLPSGSADWLEARYQTALALQKLNRTDAACGVATMTLVLHPDAAQGERGARFRVIRRQSCPETAG